MDKNLFFILTAVCLTTHIIRTIYEILKHKNIIKPNKLSFILMLINMLLLWASWFKLCEIDIYKINVPGIVRYFSLAISIAGVFIFLISLFTIKALENYEGDLMTKGIYSKIRHPMYLSFITWLIGFSIFSEALFSLIFSIILISNILFWRYLEEKELVLRFPAYNEYKKRTLF